MNEAKTRIVDLDLWEGGKKLAEVVKAQAAEIEALRAERDALRADAERYQALRRGQKWSVVDGIGNTLRAEELDAAIDAAKEQQG